MVCVGLHMFVQLASQLNVIWCRFPTIQQMHIFPNSYINELAYILKGSVMFYGELTLMYFLIVEKSIKTKYNGFKH